MDQQNLLETAFKMTMALGFVLLLFGASLYLFKRFAGTSRSFLKRNPRGANKPMEVLAHQGLGPGRSLYLVRCLNKKILVGATSSSLRSLIELEDEDDEEVFSQSLEEKIGEKSESNLKDTFKKGLREISRI